MWRASPAVLVLVVACAPTLEVDVDEGGSSGGEVPSTDASASTSETNGPVSGTSGAGGGGGYEDDDGGTGCTFTCPDPPSNPGGGLGGFECDFFAQDCPDQQKCVPWSNTGAPVLNASKCVPLQPEPSQPGEPCVAEASGFSGVDNCALGSFCFNVDPRALEGVCVSLCQGAADQPTCPEEGVWCHLVDAAPLCLRRCDPLADDCDSGQGCYPEGADFVCLLAGNVIGPGVECERVNDCVSGMFCAHASLSPECAGDGCCVEFCDTTGPSGQCFDANATCTPLADPPPGPTWENLGVCAG